MIAYAAILKAEVAACKAQLEAMKVANVERERQNYAPAYNEKAFLEVQDRILSALTSYKVCVGINYLT